MLTLTHTFPASLTSFPHAPDSSSFHSFHRFSLTYPSTFHIPHLSVSPSPPPFPHLPFSFTHTFLSNLSISFPTSLASPLLCPLLPCLLFYHFSIAFHIFPFPFSLHIIFTPPPLTFFILTIPPFSSSPRFPSSRSSPLRPLPLPPPHRSDMQRPPSPGTQQLITRPGSCRHHHKRARNNCSFAITVGQCF